jgi:hypothetical protein
MTHRCYRSIGDVSTISGFEKGGKSLSKMITIKPKDIGADPVKESMWVWGLETISNRELGIENGSG